MRKHDWADDLAKRIAFDLGADSAERRQLGLVGHGSASSSRKASARRSTRPRGAVAPKVGTVQ